MSRNVQVVLFVSILFGAAVGVYDFALPYYLEAQRISFADMGYIFATSSLAMFVVRIYLGNLSDRLGRKIFYSLALAVSAAANVLTPWTAKIGPLIGLKSTRDAALFTREVMHPILLYEETPGKFLGFIGVTRGMEYFFQGAGTIAAGLLLALGFRLVFGVSCGLLVLAFVAFTLMFHEESRRSPSSQAIRWRDLFDFDLSPNLKLIAISSFIFSLGLSTSHCFIMPLFFSQKFGVSKPTVAVVMMIHRFSLAVPMVFAGLIPRRHFRMAYIWPLLAEGMAISLSAMIPGFFPAAAVWLLHDLIGASLWTPVQNTIIQEFCRPQARGSDVSKTLALGALGGIGGPFLAGYLAPLSISAPFLLSGAILLIAAIPILKLRLDAHAVASQTGVEAGRGGADSMRRG
jgi:MFS family permease